MTLAASHAGRRVGRYPIDNQRIYDNLEDALAALDMARDAVRGALEAASYRHLSVEAVDKSRDAA